MLLKSFVVEFVSELDQNASGENAIRSRLVEDKNGGIVS